MKTAGVKETFVEKDFISCLKQMKQKFGDTKLDKKNTEVAVNMAVQLVKCLTGSEDTLGSTKTRKYSKTNGNHSRVPRYALYNDKPFTEADIVGIQNLGEGSKGDDPNKTGQYGVGFNAVYHLTDAPSFASSGEEIGDVLCVF
ncbi:hypothetical protein OS493_010861 [Desmophyllum pertusum]|uniref:Sacsin/Nov domain-containing protein n=1 Tax=Desmophyllum pertusum TaxID=174260 RepID=A0A9W9ZEV0_9CNID|nr:hypothetical protein OS493_010861 [Desmophyllum pertusum]